MAYEAGQNIFDDADAVTSAYESVREQNGDTEAYSNAATVISAMLSISDDVMEDAKAQGQEQAAQESEATLVFMKESLETLADGGEVEDRDRLEANLGELSMAFQMKALEAALGGAL